MLQCKFSVGKKETKYYVWVYVVDGGIRRHKMNENDHVYIEFENSEKLDLTLTKGEIVKPEFVTTGTTSTTRYNARFEVSKEIMERLSKQNVKEVSAKLDDRDMGRKVKDRQAPNIIEAANCVLQ